MDDSSTKGIREGMGKLDAFGGLLLDANSLQSVNEEINQIMARYSIPYETEVKWSLPRGNYIRENLVEDERAELYRLVIEVARKNGGQAIVSIADSRRINVDHQATLRSMFKFVFERLSRYLSRNNEYCIVVSDEPGGGRKNEEAFLVNCLDLIRNGTEFSSPGRILLNVLTVPSHFIRHLQVADVICSVSTAMVAGYHKYALPVFNEIRPMFFKNTTGNIAGAGLKLFPKELTNLYYWILGENTFTRARRNLPIEKYPYYLDEFKV